MAGVQDIYVALFGRPADPEGLDYWNRVSNNGADLSKMLAALPFTSEYTTRFSGQSSEQIITSVYQSLFGRAPDALGLKFFAERLASGEQTIATIAVNIAQGAQGADKQTFDAKVTAAELFTKSIDTPAEIAAYRGDAAAKAAQGFLSNVDKDRPLTQGAVDQAVAGVVGGGTVGGGTGTPGPTGPFVLGKPFEQGDLTPLDINTITSVTDPLFTSQWYLKNVGQRGNSTGGSTPTKHLDMNVAGAWLDGYTGKGIRVAINDDGIDLGHQAFAKNLLKDLTYNPVIKRAGADAYDDESVTGDAHGHGTVVGSIVGMAAKDGVSLVGVAPDSKLVSGLALERDMRDVPHLHDYMTTTAKIDVSVNSYGRDPAFSENFFVGPNAGDYRNQVDKDYHKAYAEALERAAEEGRGGLGIVTEISSGNERNKRADAGMTGTTNNKHVITVGSINEHGLAATYSTGGASILVSALGGEDNSPDADENIKTGDVNRGYSLATADLTGPQGDNTRSSQDGGDFSFNNYGTSYSGPIVGATVALMLQANPNLGFRDVANILAMTARQTIPINHVPAADFLHESLVTLKGDLVNFGGLTFSRAVGFGLVDITAAVRLAASWVEEARTTRNWLSSEGTGAVAPESGAANSPDGILVKTTLAQNVVIERMEFELDLTSLDASKLRAEVTSPEGTTIVLFDRPLVSETEANKVWPGIFQIGATAFLGEHSSGEWTLKITDTTTGMQVATYNSLTVRAWGSPVTEDSHYVLTDAFAGNKTFADNTGMDLINGAAVSTAMRIDLHRDAVSTIYQADGTTVRGTFRIGANDDIENAFGGAGDDFIIGNDLGNILRGNGGADTLRGNGGPDIFMFGTVNESHVGAPDTVEDFTPGVDYIDLRLLDANVRMAGNQEFRFGGQSDTVVASGVVLNYSAGNTIVLADIDGDVIADVKIILTGQLALSGGDFLGLAA